MKELITTQLIEEYQKELDDTYEKLTLNEKEGKDVDGHKALSVQRNVLRRFITSLQSKQSEERQNIVDAVTDTIENTSYQKDGDGYIHCEFDGEDYFNKTFKQV